MRKGCCNAKLGVSHVDDVAGPVSSFVPRHVFTCDDLVPGRDDLVDQIRLASLDASTVFSLFGENGFEDDESC